MRCCFILFLVILLSKTVSYELPASFFEQAKNTIQSNTKGLKCSVKYSSLLALQMTLPGKDVFISSVYHPNPSELKNYHALPKSLTRANQALGGGHMFNFKAERWAASKDHIWQLPASHPRNSKKRLCVDSSKAAGEYAVQLYNETMENLVPMYIMKLSHGFIHDIGRKWYDSCTKNLKGHGRRWEDMWNVNLIKYPKSPHVLSSSLNSSYFGCASEGPEQYLPRHFQKVFVLSGSWDNNYHHFLLDSVVKLVRYYDFIQSNPKMLIHIRGSEKFAKKEKYTKGGIELRKRIFELLNIDLSRVINGSIIADEVYLPRTTVCNSPQAHALEIRSLAKILSILSFKKQIRALRPSLLLAQLQTMPFHGDDSIYARLSKKLTVTEALGDVSQLLHHGGHSTTVHGSRSGTNDIISNIATDLSSNMGGNDNMLSSKKVLILQHRHCATAKECKKTWREWSLPVFEDVYSAFERVYGASHIVVPMSSVDKKSSSCLQCQVRQYTVADIVVGIHGAGMTNIMFMKPGSFLVEIAGQFDGRMLPICGYHGPLAAIFGVHHYIFYYDWKEGPLNPDRIALESWQFYNELLSSTNNS